MVRSGKLCYHLQRLRRRRRKKKNILSIGCHQLAYPTTDDAMLTSPTASTAGKSCHTTAMTTSTTDSKQLKSDRMCTGLVSRTGTAGLLFSRLVSEGFVTKSVTFSPMDCLLRLACLSRSTGGDDSVAVAVAAAAVPALLLAAVSAALPMSSLTRWRFSIALKL